MHLRVPKESPGIKRTPREEETLPSHIMKSGDNMTMTIINTQVFKI